MESLLAERKVSAALDVAETALNHIGYDEAAILVGGQPVTLVKLLYDVTRLTRKRLVVVVAAIPPSQTKGGVDRVREPSVGTEQRTHAGE